MSSLWRRLFCGGRKKSEAEREEGESKKKEGWMKRVLGISPSEERRKQKEARARVENEKRRLLDQNLHQNVAGGGGGGGKSGGEGGGKSGGEGGGKSGGGGGARIQAPEPASSGNAGSGEERERGRPSGKSSSSPERRSSEERRKVSAMLEVKPEERAQKSRSSERSSHSEIKKLEVKNTTAAKPALRPGDTIYATVQELQEEPDVGDWAPPLPTTETTETDDGLSGKGLLFGRHHSIVKKTIWDPWAPTNVLRNRQEFSLQVLKTNLKLNNGLTLPLNSDLLPGATKGKTDKRCTFNKKVRGVNFDESAEENFGMCDAFLERLKAPDPLYLPTRRSNISLKEAIRRRRQVSSRTPEDGQVMTISL